MTVVGLVRGGLVHESLYTCLLARLGRTVVGHLQNRDVVEVPLELLEQRVHDSAGQALERRQVDKTLVAGVHVLDALAH